MYADQLSFKLPMWTCKKGYEIANAVTVCSLFLQHGQQKLSYSGIVLIGLLWLVMFIMLFLSIGQVINWLDYLYIISYIKLSVTPIKYIPQVSGCLVVDQCRGEGRRRTKFCVKGSQRT